MKIREPRVGDVYFFARGSRRLVTLISGPDDNFNWSGFLSNKSRLFEEFTLRSSIRKGYLVLVCEL